MPVLVKELAVTPLLSVAPVSVPAAAVTVIAAVPSKSVPLMALAVARAVAVADRATAMFADPLNEVPPIVRAVSSTVASAAVPEVSWFPAVFTPGKSIFPVPSNDTPPIFLADARAVAVAARPEQAAAVDTVTTPPAVIVALPLSANSAATFEPLPIQIFVLASGELVGSM